MSAHSIHNSLSPVAAVLICTAVMVSCDRDQPVAPPATPAPPTKTAEPTVTIETLAPLWPNQPTHLAVVQSAGGAVVFFSQPTKEGRDVVMQYGARSFPETTALSSASIASALGEADLPGNIIAMSGYGNGKLYFLFKAQGEKQSKFALGEYDPRNTKTRILSDTTTLLHDSGLGASIELATATLVGTESSVWLLFATIDETVLLRFEPAKMPGRGLIELARPFNRATAGEEVLQLGGRSSRLSAGPGDTLMLTDTHAAGIFQIDRAGKATELGTLVALPDRIAPAAALSGDGVALFVGEGEEIRGSVESRLEAAKVSTNFPAVLIYRRNGKIVAIPRERITARPGLPVYALRVVQTASEGDNSFIAYDAASGELMRVTIR